MPNEFQWLFEQAPMAAAVCAVVWMFLKRDAERDRVLEGVGKSINNLARAIGHVESEKERDQ